MTNFFDNYHVIAWSAQLLAAFACVPPLASCWPDLTRWKRLTLTLLLATVWLWSPWAMYGTYRAYTVVHTVSITALRAIDAPATPERPL